MQPVLRILQLPQPLQRDVQELDNTSKRTLKMSHGPPLEVDEFWIKTPRQGRVADKLTTMPDGPLYDRNERIILAAWGEIRHMLVTKYRLDDVASGANESHEDNLLRCTAIALQKTTQGAIDAIKTYRMITRGDGDQTAPRHSLSTTSHASSSQDTHPLYQKTTPAELAEVFPFSSINLSRFCSFRLSSEFKAPWPAMPIVVPVCIL